MLTFTFLGLDWEINFSSWSWWVSQFFSLLLLVCLVVSMQQKTRTRLMWWNTIGMAFGLIGGFFLGLTSVIIFMTINLARNITVLIISYFPKTKPAIIWTLAVILIAALTIANIVFRVNWLNYMSIAVGIGFIIAFFQPTPKKMRLGIAIVRVPAFVFSILTTNLVQALTELVAFTSGLVAIIRHDINKKVAPDKQGQATPAAEEVK